MSFGDVSHQSSGHVRSVHDKNPASGQISKSLGLGQVIFEANSQSLGQVLRWPVLLIFHPAATQSGHMDDPCVGMLNQAR